MFIIEYIVVGIFLLEYLMRFVTCTADERYQSKHHNILGRFKFMISWSSLIDFVAIIPSLITLNWTIINCLRLSFKC